MLRDWLGQVGHRVEIGRGLPLEFTPEIYPVAIVHFTSGSIGEVDFRGLNCGIKGLHRKWRACILEWDCGEVARSNGDNRGQDWDKTFKLLLCKIKDIDHPVTDKYTLDQPIDLKAVVPYRGNSREKLEDGIKYLESRSSGEPSGYRYAMFETGYGDGRYLH